MAQRDSPAFASAEVGLFWRYICSSIDRLVGVLDGQPIEILNWRPPAAETNSIYVLAHHTLSNARVNVLGNLCGREIGRDRASEFSVVAGDGSQPDCGWAEIRRELEGALSGLTDAALDAEYAHHWRGAITGRDILIIVARHAAEHLGQAELTRDLALAAVDRGAGRSRVDRAYPLSRGTAVVSGRECPRFMRCSLEHRAQDPMLLGPRLEVRTRI